MKRILIFLFLLVHFLTLPKSTLATDSITYKTTNLITKIEKEYFNVWMNKQFLNRLQDQFNKGKEGNKIFLQSKNQIKRADSISRINLMNDIATLKSIDKGEAVVLLTDTLFKVYKRSGSFNREETAKNISKRIVELGDNRHIYPDSILLVPQLNGSYNYEYLGETLFNLKLIELALINLENPNQAAQFILVILRRKLVDYHNLNDFSVLIKKLGIGLGIILGIIVLLVFLNKLFVRFRKYTLKNEKAIVKKIGIKKEQELLKKLFTEFFQKAISLFQFVIFGFIIYLGLPILFNVFPQTKFITTTLLSWIIEPAYRIWQSAVNFLPDFITILVIYFITRFVIRLLKFFYTEVERGRLKIKGFHKEFAKPTFQIIQFLIYAFMLVVIFPYLPGSESPAFKGVTVFIGVLFSLGSSSALSNIMAGMVLTYMRPFKLGDRVKIGDCTGDVIEKTILVTKIRTIKNEEITLPNATVLNAQTLNYSMFAKTEGLILHSTVTIGYDVPWNKMHAVLIEAAIMTKYINNTPAPFVLQTSLDDFYVSYQINAYTNEANQQISIYSDLHQNIQDCCTKAGIEIMSPHYNSLRDGNQSTIPKA